MLVSANTVPSILQKTDCLSLGGETTNLFSPRDCSTMLTIVARARTLSKKGDDFGRSYPNHRNALSSYIGK
jgi:hypothetical protein